MPGNIFEIFIALMFLFIGVKYLVTKEYQDRENIYTEESKRKAAIIAGTAFVIGAILEGIYVALMYQGIVVTKGNDGIPYFIPSLGIVAFLLLMILIVRTKVLKKK